MKKLAVIGILACYCLYQSVFSHIATMSMEMMPPHHMMTMETMTMSSEQQHDAPPTHIQSTDGCHDMTRSCCDSIASCMGSCREREKDKAAIELPSRTTSEENISHDTPAPRAWNTILPTSIITYDITHTHRHPPSAHDLLDRIGTTVRII